VHLAKTAALSFGRGADGRQGRSVAKRTALFSDLYNDMTKSGKY
jgi:hypothetical protein